MCHIMYMDKLPEVKPLEEYNFIYGFKYGPTPFTQHTFWQLPFVHPFFYPLLKTTPFLQPPSLHLLKYAAPKFINTLLVTSN